MIKYIRIIAVVVIILCCVGCSKKTSTTIQNWMLADSCSTKKCIESFGTPDSDNKFDILQWNNYILFDDISGDLIVKYDESTNLVNFFHWVSKYDNNKYDQVYNYLKENYEEYIPIGVSDDSKHFVIAKKDKDSISKCILSVKNDAINVYFGPTTTKTANY